MEHIEQTQVADEQIEVVEFEGESLTMLDLNGNC